LQSNLLMRGRGRCNLGRSRSDTPIIAITRLCSEHPFGPIAMLYWAALQFPHHRVHCNYTISLYQQSTSYCHCNWYSSCTALCRYQIQRDYSTRASISKQSTLVNATAIYETQRNTLVDAMYSFRWKTVHPEQQRTKYRTLMWIL